MSWDGSVLSKLNYGFVAHHSADGARTRNPLPEGVCISNHRLAQPNGVTI